MACYELGDLSQAEDALCEANILNNLDPVIWAYLTMLCLKVPVIPRIQCPPSLNPGPRLGSSDWWDTESCDTGTHQHLFTVVSVCYTMSHSNVQTKRPVEAEQACKFAVKVIASV